MALHPHAVSVEALRQVVDMVRTIFPFCYEDDGETPFDPDLHETIGFQGGEDDGTEIMCMWSPSPLKGRKRDWATRHLASEAATLRCSADERPPACLTKELTLQHQRRCSP